MGLEEEEIEEEEEEEEEGGRRRVVWGEMGEGGEEEMERERLEERRRRYRYEWKEDKKNFWHGYQTLWRIVIYFIIFFFSFSFIFFLFFFSSFSFSFSQNNIPFTDYCIDRFMNVMLTKLPLTMKIVYDFPSQVRNFFVKILFTSKEKVEREMIN